MEIYLPSESEIRRKCLEIRESWSERELFKRSGLPEPIGWMPPGTTRPLGTRFATARRMTGED